MYEASSRFNYEGRHNSFALNQQPFILTRNTSSGPSGLVLPLRSFPRCYLLRDLPRAPSHISRGLHNYIRKISTCEAQNPQNDRHLLRIEYRSQDTSSRIRYVVNIISTRFPKIDPVTFHRHMAVRPRRSYKGS
jgi:hypothetical protein